MSTIKSVHARRVWDSRGHPTIEVDVTTESGDFGRAIAPSGASRGTREAIELRDGGTRIKGLDVSKAVAAVNEKIASKLVGMDVDDQENIDQTMIALDGTKLKTSLGGNAMVATSLAVLHAAAANTKQPLWRHIGQKYGFTPSIPLPEIQIFGGGAHANRRVDVQDFMVMVPGAKSFDEALEVTAEIYHAAGTLMAKKGGKAGVADEGGWWPNFKSNEDALETLVKAIELAGEKPGERVAISLDIAASEFGSKGLYRLALEDRELDTGQMIGLLGDWIKAYPILSIEDPLAEDDPEGMRLFTQKFGYHLQIIGDDYLVTNAALVDEAAKAGACNAVLVKVNQAGTVTESIATYRAANAANWRSIVSARSGETEDISIVHLSTGLGCGQLKVGSFTRSERMAKWNETLRLEETLGTGTFAGGEAFTDSWWGQGKTGYLV